MLFIYVLLGVIVGWSVTGWALGGVVGAIVAVGLVVLVGIGRGMRSEARARTATPVDLETPEPVPLDPTTYSAQPLALRNAIIARTVASSTDRPVEYVTYALPDLMGMQERSNIPTRKTVEDLLGATDPLLLDHGRVDAVISGEMLLGVANLRRVTEHARTTIERNAGRPLTDDYLRVGLLTSVFPLFDRMTLGEALNGAEAGTVNLAFAVGLLRKVVAKESDQFERMPESPS